MGHPPRTRRLIVRSLAACALSGTVLGADPGAPNGPTRVRVEAFTMPSVDLTLTFTIPGVVADLPVKDGTMVKAGQMLAKLDDREATSQIALYRIRAESTLAEDLASAELELAQTELARVREAFEKGGMGDLEVKRRELETRLAELRLKRAEQDRAEAALVLEQARATAQRAVLEAPVAGMVERTVVDVGESVERLAPVIRLVSIDPLRVEASVPIAEGAGIGVGSPVTLVGTDLDATLTGTVERVAAVADAASGTVLVTIVAPNPRGFPAGSRVWVEFAETVDNPGGVRSGPGGVE